MNRLPSIRRWGVAALTGVTLFGGLSIVGAGVASAATPTVSVALTTNATATTIAGDATASAGGSLTVTVTGTPVAGDQIALTLACPSAGTAVFSGITDSSTAWGTPVITTNTAGCSVATFTETALLSPNSLTLVPSYTLTGVSSQALSISGTYTTFGAGSSFTVPTDVSALWFGVSANTPAVTLPSTGTTAVSPITISEPANLTGAFTGGTVTLTLTGAVWSTATTPTVSSLPAETTPSTVAPSSTTALVVTLGSLPVTSVSSSLTLNNLSITTTGNTPGTVTVAIAASAPVETLYTGLTVGTVLGTATTIAGIDGTADGTVATEFESAYTSNANVVLATDAPNANGSDALAASYLEGLLGTGLLITSPTSLGADAQEAMRLEGVSTVYVVGGPLAISPAVLAQIEALPVYTNHGLTATSTNVKVVGPIYGTDGTAAGTAAKIATYFNSFGSLQVPGAYAATNGFAGLYNDTTGNATAAASAPTGSTSTAIVVASSDWQDAMSIAPEAFYFHIPVILNGPSSDTSLDADAQGALTSLGVKQVIVIGGNLALQNSVVTAIQALNGGVSVLRIAGVDATDTAAQIANFAWGASGTTGLGWNKNSVIASHADYWSDALGAAALGGTTGTYGPAPIILTENPTTVGTYTTAELATLKTDGVVNLTVLGGPLAMPALTVQQLLSGL
jgi:putative cell wall-binding protein